MTADSPVLPEVAKNLAPVGNPVTGRIISNDSCMKGKSASFVRHTEIDVSGTSLEGNCLVGQSFGVLTPGVDPKGKPHKVRLYSVACPSYGEDGAGRIISTTPKRLIEEFNTEEKSPGPTENGLFLGVCSNYLCKLKRGDEVRLTGPNGKRFLLPIDRDKHDYIFIATGTGIAPFRGMAMELLTHPDYGCTTSQIHLLMGAPYTSDLLYDDLFTHLSAKHDNFHYHTAISREMRPDGSRGCYIHQLMEEQIGLFGPILENPRTVLYICGLAGMQTGLYQAMASHGVHKGYFTVKDKLADIDPTDWEPSQIRRGVKATGRCMVEVY